MEVKYRYRNKKDKIQVQKFENNKWISRTLPYPEVTFNWLCPINVSKNSAEIKQKSVQKYEQSLLTEQQNKDTDINEQCKKAQNDLMKDILGIN